MFVLKIDSGTLFFQPLLLIVVTNTTMHVSMPNAHYIHYTLDKQPHVWERQTPSVGRIHLTNYHDYCHMTIVHHCDIIQQCDITMECHGNPILQLLHYRPHSVWSLTLLSDLPCPGSWEIWVIQLFSFIVMSWIVILYLESWQFLCVYLAELSDWLVAFSCLIVGWSDIIWCYTTRLSHIFNQYWHPLLRHCFLSI